MSLARGATAEDTLSWQPKDGAITYNVCRGPLSELSGSRYGSCYRAAMTGLQTTIPEDPAPGAGFAYLVTVDRGGGEGTLGADSDGVERSNGTPCQ